MVPLDLRGLRGPPLCHWMDISAFRCSILRLVKPHFFIQCCLKLKSKFDHTCFALEVDQDMDGEGALSKRDFERSALKYAILYCKGDKIKDFCDMFLEVFHDLFAYIKEAGQSLQVQLPADFVNFREFRAMVGKLSQDSKNYNELPQFLQKLIDMLFQSYDTKGDNCIDEDEFRLYLCARNMDLKRASECFKFMTGESKAKMKKPQFRQLMFDYLTSIDSNSKGKYICGPYDSAKKDHLEKYIKLATGY